MLKTVLLTHTDLDGAGCRIVFSLAHQHLKEDEWKILNCSNSNVDEQAAIFIDSDDVNVDTIICFGDICASRGILDKLVERFHTIKIWDHHKTNTYALEVIPDAAVIPENDIGKKNCGTSLMYQYFCGLDINDPRGDYFRSKGNQVLLTDFVETVRSYDTFEWKSTNNKDAKRMVSLFFLIGMDRFCNKYLNRLKDKDSSSKLFLDSDLEFIEARIENEQSMIDEVDVDKLFHVEVKGLKAVVMFTGTGVSLSELGYQLLTKYPKIDVFIGINFGTGTINYRCVKDNIDTGFYLAKPAKGGGHPLASGNPIPAEITQFILDVLREFIENPDGFFKWVEEEKLAKLELVKEA
jgi:oligoribonuclease NrnB/cAMP/cGMP phosphodiesterase (DHH superfamily)